MRTSAWVVSIAWALGGSAHAVEPTAADRARAHAWAAAALDADPAGGRIFSFTYGGAASQDLLGTWRRTAASRDLGGGRIERSIAWTDPKTGLAVRCIAVASAAFPAIEWTVYLKNGGAADTPIIEDLRAIDLRWRRDATGDFVLHHHRGDICAAESFAPMTSALDGPAMHFAPVGGRPSNGAWPYFHLELGGGGILIAIGWPGQWAAEFAREGDDAVRIRAGQERTHFLLHSGEEVRTPLIAILFHEGDWIRGQNIWRRWMLEENHPKDHGKPLRPMLAGCSGWHFPKLMCNQAGEIEFIDRYLAEGIRLDLWWMDAGWYPCDGVGWPKVGTWEVDAKRYPGGLRAVADHAHAKGLGTVVWFEPERVHAGTWLAAHHPEWIHGGAGGGLLDLGNPAARAWITDRVDALISTEGVDLYRQDFNIDPLPFWRGADPPDRQGIAEMRHIEGYLAFWDELRRRHPGMLIDSCASGGRRNDLETMRRAVPLLRSDFEFQADGNQCHTYGFDLWLPYHSLGNRDIDPYSFRSNLSPMMGFVWDVRRRDLDYDRIRRNVAEWRRVADCFLGDFHPLTPYATADDVWMAWQFHRPDAGRGMVQAFRRGACESETAVFRLHALDPGARYAIADLDRPGETEAAGRALMEDGLTVRISERPGAALIVYRRVEVLPIDVGRQLFIDDYLIESTDLRRTFHTAEFHPASPVLRPDRPWESDTVSQGHPAPTAMVFSDGVWYDPQDRLFKMWYMGGYVKSTCYATSRDGIRWEKPALDVVPGTNIVEPNDRDSATVWLDLREPDPARRYKLFLSRRHGPSRALSISFSRDGIHWGEPVAWSGPCGDRTTVFHDPFRDAWVYSIRDYVPGDGRVRRRAMSPDVLAGARWEAGEPIPWVGADRLDPPREDLKGKPELYNLDAVAYESLLLGLFTIWPGQPRDRAKPNYVALGFSRDGFHWQRPDRRPFIGVSEKRGDWNWGNVQSAGGGCLVVGDRLYFYVSGRAGVPGSPASGTCATGLATLRRDGFASLDADPDGGTVTTRPVRFSGKHLFVNADAARGELRVEVLDAGGGVIAPFARDACAPVRADATLAEVRWEGAADLSAVAGRPVRLRFLLRDARLFAFWVAPDASGASRGYVAAGGPGFTGPTDTVGRSGYRP
ncbi:MAG: alpha-galactosidase [Planctomycetes bacterium]|nr:alpha-galactosidase [Planctomycetota bacterium]